jgi:hypothetical protein
MNSYYIQELEQDYNNLRNLYTSMLDAGVYDRNPQRQKEDQQRLKNLLNKIFEEKEAAE